MADMAVFNFGEGALVLVFRYYLAMWVINSGAYFAVGLGIRRWLVFLKGLEAEHGIRLTMRATFLFGCLRVVMGGIGALLYYLGDTGVIGTILILGMSSLALNTTFILGEGVIFNREAKKLTELPPETQEDLRGELRQFEALLPSARRTFAGLQDTVDRVH
jgi:hypothetical protein